MSPEPSVAERVLHYHWFSNAHVAASHLMTGIDLPTIYLRLWEIPVVVMTAWGSVEVAVEAMRRGARDFVQKPWENARPLTIGI